MDVIREAFHLILSGDAELLQIIRTRNSLHICDSLCTIINNRLLFFIRYTLLRLIDIRLCCS